MWASIGDGTHTSQRHLSQAHVITITFSERVDALLRWREIGA